MAQDDSFGLTFGGSLLGGERLVLHWQMPEEVITEERRVGFLQFWDVLGQKYQISTYIYYLLC